MLASDQQTHSETDHIVIKDSSEVHLMFSLSEALAVIVIISGSDKSEGKTIVK
jgi:hypothetical protein